MTIPIKELLNLLVVQKALSQPDADKYEIESLQKNIPIDEYIVKYTKVKKEALLEAKSKIIKIPWVDVNYIPITPQALYFIPESIARNYSVIPYELNQKEGALKVAMADPLNMQFVEFLEKKTNKKIIPILAIAEDIQKAIDVFYSQALSPEVSAALKDIGPENQTTMTKNISDIVNEAPIAKIVGAVLEFSVSGRASDIHIEPEELKTRVRYRIDGILHEKLTLPKQIHESLVSRIKIMSGLKIDEKRIPQDGRFNFKTGNEDIDLRVSTLPTVHGEKIVMRLLKKTGGIPTLFDLGLRGPQLKVIEEAITKPYGVILVTGPTGSGKTTTLYSALSKLNNPKVNIVTVEDPVEYQLNGVNQVQINPQAGLTFASALRSFLRQDPNIILVGEIRDKETAQLAIQAALTGHLVFSTLHTNDAPTAIPRLIDLGGEPFLIASVLDVALAQRICRKICVHCKVSYTPLPEVLQNIKQVLAEYFVASLGAAPHLYKAKGCPECNDTGYYGRIGIFEVLKITPAINQLIVRQTTVEAIELTAKKDGFMTMKQDGFLKALEGITTIEEVLRVAET